MSNVAFSERPDSFISYITVETVCKLAALCQSESTAKESLFSKMMSPLDQISR